MSTDARKKLGSPAKRKATGPAPSIALPKIRRTEEVQESKEYKERQERLTKERKERRAEKNAAFFAERKLSIKPSVKLSDLLSSVKSLPKTTISSGSSQEKQPAAAEKTPAAAAEKPPVAASQPPPPTPMSTETKPAASSTKESRPVFSKASPYLRR
jgi:hypothetical protein